MKVSVALTSALLAGLALVTVTPAFAAGKNTNSEKVAKLLAPAQEMLKAKNYNGALGLIKQAEAVSDKTPFDVYTIAEFACQANIGAQNYAEAAKTCEEQLNEQLHDRGERAASGAHSAGAQLPDQELRQGDRVWQPRGEGRRRRPRRTARSSASPITSRVTGRTRSRPKTRWWTAELKAGQVPKDQQLGLMLNSCIKLEDNACQQKASKSSSPITPSPSTGCSCCSRCRAAAAVMTPIRCRCSG